MSKLNILYGTAAAILAVVFFISIFSFPSEQRGLDPRVYPLFISICFFALSVGLIASGVLLRKEKEKGTGEEAGTEKQKEQGERARLDGAEIAKQESVTGERGQRLKEQKGFKESFLSPALQRIGGMFLVALGYVAIIDTVGYLVATPPFLAGSMLLFGERRIWRILLVSILSTAILFWLFRIIFRVPLPVSSLW